MQTLVLVACTPGPSIREAIVRDAQLSAFQLELIREKRRGRRPGWAKVKSAVLGIDGAVNLEWDYAAYTLQCRVVTRSGSDPAPILGDLVGYLFERFPDRIQSISILPRP
ncbi:MAG: hypothetical protein AB1449_02420 [Chloroflexota bacterium]